MDLAAGIVFSNDSVWSAGTISLCGCLIMRVCCYSATSLKVKRSADAEMLRPCFLTEEFFCLVYTELIFGEKKNERTYVRTLLIVLLKAFSHEIGFPRVLRSQVTK